MSKLMPALNSLEVDSDQTSPRRPLVLSLGTLMVLDRAGIGHTLNKSKNMKEQLKPFSEKSEKSKQFCSENFTGVKAATLRTSLAAWRTDSAAHFMSWLINRVNMHSSNPSTGLFLMKLIFRINEFHKFGWVASIHSYSYFQSIVPTFRHITQYLVCVVCQDVERWTRYRRRCFCVSSAACQASHYLLPHPITLILEFDDSKSLRFKTISHIFRVSLTSLLQFSCIGVRGSVRQNLCTFCLNCIVSL